MLKNWLMLPKPLIYLPILPRIYPPILPRIYPPIGSWSPALLTPDVFLPVKEVSPISKVSPPTSSSSKKKSSLSKKKKKALMKAFWESLDVSYDEDEEESDASSEATINPQREFFGNSGVDTQEYFPGLEDL
jgi:hypothetical protein